MKNKLLIFASICVLIFGLLSFKNDKTLKQELNDIWYADQNLRKEYSEVWKKFGKGSHEVDSISNLMKYTDSIHVVRVSQILDEYGWLGKDKIGQQANNTLFLVIQHADLKTQQKYLPMMRDAVKDGKSEPGWLALLEDRVALREGRKQIYGSQIFFNQGNNTYYVAPLEDPDNVDKRRSEVGLNKLERYLKDWNIVWNVEEYKKQLPELELLTKQELERSK